MTLARRIPAMLALLMLGACGVPEGDSATSAETADGDEQPPIPVEVARPTRGDVHAVYTGTAAIEAYAEADVLAKVAGEVVEILVEEGDEVVAGQVLARLDGERLRLELKETEAKLSKLERDYERNVDLSERGLISEGDFEKIRYDMEALRASYNLASLELDYTQIRAPIDGVVAERFVKLGNTLAVSDPLFRVTSLDPLVAYMHVPEREFRNIEPGQPVGIRIDALDGPPIVVSVTRVSPVVDPETGTFKVTIEIDDPERRVKPGMFARFGIVYDTHENALRVPRSALVEDREQPAVFVVEDGKAVRVDVETGYAGDGMVEITDGLGEDDRVIVVGQVGLKPDATVEIIDSATAEPAAEDQAVAGNGSAGGEG